MFKRISQELTGIRLQIDGLTKAVRVASEGLREATLGGADAERLSQLEGRMESVLGQVDAGLVRADALKATARAAEDRARGHMKRAEVSLELAKGIESGEDIDPFEAAARAYAEVAPGGDGDANGGVPALPSGVESILQGAEYARAQKRRR